MALPKGLPQVSDLNEVYDSLGAGFNAFVDENASVLTASSSMPAGQLGGSGVFRSSVIGRAPITDLGNDLKVNMGVERIAVQQITQLQNEFGPNGEPVWAAVNDAKDLIRYVGQWTFNFSANPVVGGSVLNDYVEITFYGTGLNLLGVGLATRDARASVDGQAVGSNIYPSGNFSTPYNGRGYYHNIVIPVVSGLPLGIHTVKLINYAAAADIPHSGFEILNESSTLKVNPGIAYIKGQKYSLTTAQSPAYNSSFESGALGTKGGRVLVYQKSDGSIAKAVTPTDASTLYLGSANHQNEEVMRAFHFREFGAGRTDDFSRLGSTATSVAFTLDDGITTLTGNLAQTGPAGTVDSVYCVSAGRYLTLTFVGTGVDILTGNPGGNPTITYDFAVDGVTIPGGSGVSGASFPAGRINKVVSGLPYGTHTLKITVNSAAVPTYGIHILSYVVYGPKKPVIPSGAVELADYSVMADYSASSTVGTAIPSTGVLRKTPMRELIYVDAATAGTAWSVATGTVVPNLECGFQIDTNRNNSYFEYTFFGTGIEFRTGIYPNHSNNISVTLNGTALNASYPGAAAINVGTLGAGMTYGSNSGLSFALSTVASNILNTNGGLASSGCSFRVWNLPLGRYTIRFTNNNNPNYLAVDAVDVITPIHSPKSNLYADVQNTLTVGNCAISDNRKTSAIKEALPAQKAWAQAVGVTTNPTTNSSYPTFVPCPDLSATITINGTALAIDWSGMFYASVLSGPITNATNAVSQIYVDGRPVGTIRFETISITGGNVLLTDSIIVPVSPGTHKVDIYWCKDGAVTTLVASEDRRTLIVREL